MDSLQALDKRITSTTKLQGIVKSMKTLAAVSMRQYERALESLDDFVDVIEQGVIATMQESSPPSIHGDISAAPVAFVVFGSDQGLCGRFNERLAEYILQYVREMGIESSRLKLLVIGARIAPRLETAGLAVSDQFWVPSSVGGINSNVHQVLLTLEQWLHKEKINYVVTFYNRHKRLSAAKPRHEVLLPIQRGRLQMLATEKWQGLSLPYYRTDTQQLFSALVKQYLMVSLFRAQAGSLAAEQASRLRSLQSAEKNIEEHVDDLRGEYRVKRQATVTSELLDLVAGFKSARSAKNIESNPAN